MVELQNEDQALFWSGFLVWPCKVLELPHHLNSWPDTNQLSTASYSASCTSSARWIKNDRDEVPWWKHKQHLALFQRPHSILHGWWRLTPKHLPWAPVTSGWGNHSSISFLLLSFLTCKLCLSQKFLLSRGISLVCMFDKPFPAFLALLSLWIPDRLWLCAPYSVSRAPQARLYSLHPYNHSTFLVNLPV